MFGLLVTAALTCGISKEPTRVDKMCLLLIRVNIELQIGNTHSVLEIFVSCSIVLISEYKLCKALQRKGN